jgi:terminase small subunit / prophage DNA-packing protein
VGTKEPGGRRNIDPAPGFVTGADYADHCGVSRKTVSIWIREGMPHERRGHHVHVPLKKADRWRTSYGRGGFKTQVGSQRKGAAKGAAEAAFDRKAAADAERAEIKLQLDRMAMARQSGELVDRALFESKAAEVFAVIRRGVMEIPLSVAIHVGAETGTPEAVLRAALDREVRRILKDIANGVEQLIG